jgi:hypothetical protein
MLGVRCVHVDCYWDGGRSIWVDVLSPADFRDIQERTLGHE